MDRLYNMKEWVASYISNQNDEIENQLMVKVNLLSTLFSENKLNLNVSIPRLVVAAVQSAGKSHLLNSLMGMDILPVGSQMSTRTPISVRLINDSSHNNATFYETSDTGELKLLKDISLTEPCLVTDEIEEITRKLAGRSKNISDQEIVIEIKSPNVPNFTFIDLPGLTMLSLTDKGQSEDIKEQIRALIGKYISDENSLILGVFPARVDLEADPVIELIKEYDPKFERTIGVLTKVDLLNRGNSVENYLTNKGVSKDLQLKHGYFAVNNGPNSFNLKDRLDNEKAFFESNSNYNTNLCKDRVGIPNLLSNLTKILNNHILETLPEIHSQVNDKLTEVKEELANLGGPLPNSQDGKVTFLTSMLTSITREYISSLENRASVINYGKFVKDEFVEFRKTIDSIDFLEDIDDKYLSGVIQHANGNHMSLQVPIIEVLEVIIKNYRMKILEKAIEPGYDCVDKISQLLINLLGEILRSHDTVRFPNLIEKITNLVQEKLINVYSETVKENINEIVQIEKNYVWTEEEEFLNSLDELVKVSNGVELDTMRSIIQAYLKSIKKILNHQIPKIIMYNLVTKLEKNFHTTVVKILNSTGSENWLHEDSNIFEKRKLLESQLSVLNKAMGQFETEDDIER